MCWFFGFGLLQTSHPNSAKTHPTEVDCNLQHVCMIIQGRQALHSIRSQQTPFEFHLSPKAQANWILATRSGAKETSTRMGKGERGKGSWQELWLVWVTFRECCVYVCTWYVLPIKIQITNKHTVVLWSHTAEGLFWLVDWRGKREWQRGEGDNIELGSGTTYWPHAHQWRHNWAIIDLISITTKPNSPTNINTHTHARTHTHTWKHVAVTAAGKHLLWSTTKIERVDKTGLHLCSTSEKVK